MAQATVERRPVARREAQTLSARIVNQFHRWPVHLTLAVIAVFWLVPTVGLLVTSFRDRSDIQASGWWHAIVNWSFTFSCGSGDF